MQDSKRLELMGKGLAWENVTKAKTNSAGHALLEIAPRVSVMEDEIERLRAGHDRYETARRMNPQQWADAWKLNLSTGKPFDEIIDNLRPFMMGPNVQAEGAAHDLSRSSLRAPGSAARDSEKDSGLD